MGRSTKVGTNKGRTDKTGKGTSLSSKRITPLPKLLEKAQKVFNAYIRKRDEGMPCISCKTFGTMQAGHYVPQKGGSYLRFHEWNVNAECAYCNAFDEFHLIGYRRHLIAKIGEDAVDWLEENRHMVKKWTREELEEIIKKYKV